MENADYCDLRKMVINNKSLEYLLFKEGLQGFGAYRYLNDLLRRSSNYRMRVSFLAVVATDLHTSLRYLLKIVKNYGLFVVDRDEFYSPEVTDMMLRVRLRNYKHLENKLHYIELKKKSLSVATELSKVKKKLSITIKELNDCKIASLRACAKINTISQLRLREREKEKRETASGEMQKSQLAARNISQHTIEEVDTEALNQADEVSRVDKINLADEVNPENDRNQVNGLNQKIGLNRSDGTNQSNDSQNITSKSNFSANINHSGKINRKGDQVHQKKYKINQAADKTNRAVVEINQKANEINQKASKINATPVKTLHSVGKVDYSSEEKNLNQAAKQIKENGLQSIKKILQGSGKTKLRSNWADEMERDDAYIEHIAMHSCLGKQFVKAHKRAVELIKKHEKTYSTSVGLITLNNVKYYLANLVSPESPIWRRIDEKMREVKEPQQVMEPDQFKKWMNCVKIYLGDDVISDENIHNRSPPSGPDNCVSNGKLCHCRFGKEFFEIFSYQIDFISIQR